MNQAGNVAPTISVIIPVYNREKYIGECIQSALDQTYADIEVVVVDNASSDGTWGVCQQFASMDSRVRIFRNETNIGPVGNWLVCLAKAKGRYTKILWSDDLLHPDFISRLLPHLEDEAVGFVYSYAGVFGDGANPLDEDAVIEDFSKPSNRLATGVHDSRVFIEGMLIGEGFPNSPGCAIFRTDDVRKNLLLNVPNRVGSDFSMHAIGNDILLFLLTAQMYPKFAYVNENLAYFRTHAGSITTSSLPGRVTLHYDLAKGYFAENYVTNKKVLRKLNTRFLLHLMSHPARDYGIARISDFYPTKSPGGIDVLFLLKMLYQKVRSKFYGKAR